MGGLPTSTVNGFAVQPGEPNVMYAAMRDGVFRSDDAGERWTRTAGPKNAAAIAISATRPTEIHVATVGGRIFVSRDGGRKWTAVP